MMQQQCGLGNTRPGLPVGPARPTPSARRRRGDRLKILDWDRDGLAIWSQRLEAGTFLFPAVREDQQRIEVQPAELAMLLDGVDLTSIKRRKRYQRSA